MQQSETQIRPFKASDLDAIQTIRERAFAPVFQSFRSLAGEQVAPYAYASAEQGQAAYLETMCRADDPHGVLVASINGCPVGFCSYLCDATSRTGEISLNAVDPDHAGQGIGTRLIEQALAEMRRGGMRAARVGTGGDPSHAPARRAYQKAGFDRAIPSVLLLREL